MNIVIHLLVGCSIVSSLLGMMLVNYPYAYNWELLLVTAVTTTVATTLSWVYVTPRTTIYILWGVTLVYIIPLMFYPEYGLGVFTAIIGVNMVVGAYFTHIENERREYNTNKQNGV